LRRLSVWRRAPPPKLVFHNITWLAKPATSRTRGQAEKESAAAPPRQGMNAIGGA
jgi:hypothetical protein